MNTMDIHEILKHLPHRYPFLLVDRVVDFEPGKSLHAYKNITINEPFFVGHFPHHPVLPGVLIMEALAQAAGILGGILALVLMVMVSSSGFTDAGGPADWFLIALVFGLGLVGATILVYTVAGWVRSSTPSAARR